MKSWLQGQRISLYRLAVPLLFAGLALAASLIVLDDTFLPYANQRQDALRNQIKGKPPQTYRQPETLDFWRKFENLQLRPVRPRAKSFWRLDGSGG